MGIPAGVTEKEHQERTARKNRVRDTATYIVAGLINTAISGDEEDFVYSLMDMFSLSETEAKAVLKEMKAMRKKIDPHGNWK